MILISLAALGLIFGLYGLNVVGALNQSLAPLRALSPFRYAEAVQVVMSGGLSADAIVLLAVVLVAVSASWWLFERKDFHA